MGEVPGPDGDDGILGKDVSWSHTESEEPDANQQIEAAAPDNNPDIFAVHGIVEGSETRDLPASVLFLKLKVAVRRMQGVSPTIESDARDLRNKLRLDQDDDEALADRVREVPEDRWHEKPAYFTAVLREWQNRHPS